MGMTKNGENPKIKGFKTSRVQKPRFIFKTLGAHQSIDFDKLNTNM